MWNCFQKQYAVGMMFVLLLLPVGVKAVQEAPQPASVHAPPKETVQQLELHQPVEREIKGGEPQQYGLKLIANQFAEVVVEQRGVDVAIRVIGPDHSLIAEVNTPGGGSGGAEQFFFVTGLEGMYLIEVYTVDKTATMGRYEIQLKKLRESYPDDSKRLSAQNFYIEAVRLQVMNTSESRTQAIEKYAQSLELWQSLNERKEESRLLNTIGEAYFALSNFEKARQFYQQALSRLQGEDEQKHKALILKNLTLVYSRLSRLTEAEDSARQSLRLFEEIKEEWGQGYAANALGEVLFRQGKMQEALQQCLRAIDLFQKVGDSKAEGNATSNVGVIYYQIGDINHALMYCGSSTLNRGGREF